MTAQVTVVSIPAPCEFLSANRGIATNLRYNENAPEGAGNTLRGLTHSLDYGKEGLAMKATRETNIGKTCRADDCDRPAICKGLCGKHDQRFRKTGSIAPLARTSTSERFWAKVNIGARGECWEWTAGLRGRYGLFNVPPTTIGAHRFAYIERFGPVPDGMVVDHKCHNTRCVNPDHLQAVSVAENAENYAGHLRNNQSGVRGVWWDNTNRKWIARVTHLGRAYSAGNFDDLEEAAAAVLDLRISLHTNNLTDREVLSCKKSS